MDVALASPDYKGNAARMSKTDAMVLCQSLPNMGLDFASKVTDRVLTAASVAERPPVERA